MRHWESVDDVYAVLHPRHKVAYFQRAGWTEDWITTAKEIVRNEFDRNYRFRDDVLATDATDTNERITASSATTTNLFDDIAAFRTPADGSGTVDELTRYLSAAPEDVKNEDILNWWYSQKHIYPHLYRMALDYHTVPCK